MLPSGAVGKKFVSETTKWIEYWNHDVVNFEDIALYVLMVMPALLLQKPTFKSTSKEHSIAVPNKALEAMGSW
jgi:membrane-associated PAP2 superfamily phosphatase